MNYLQEYRELELRFLEVKLNLMESFNCGRGVCDGFIKLYKNLYPSIDQGYFLELNMIYKECFGRHAFLSYEYFLKHYAQIENARKITSAELKQWYVARGFNTISKLQPIVRNFYPEVPAKDVLDFWNNKPINADSLQSIGFVKQILE